MKHLTDDDIDRMTVRLDSLLEELGITLTDEQFNQLDGCMYDLLEPYSNGYRNYN